MVEKANDTIKSNTIGKYMYASSEEMKQELTKFMIAYNLSRRHGGIVRENKGRTPIDALVYYTTSSQFTLTQSLEDFTTKLESLSS